MKARRERRMSQRVDVLLKVEYQDPRDLLNDFITNIGEGGVFIHTNLPFEVGQKITFTLSFPGLLDPVELDGIVRWQRIEDPENPGGEEGLGVEFVFHSEEQKQKLYKLMADFERNTPLNIKLPKRPFRVLLVEDNEFVKELFEHAIRRFHLENIGQGLLEVIHALDGQQALQQLENSTIDLAIIDHYLPGMNGCDLVQYIRNDSQLADLPVLVVSVGGEEVKQEAYKSGADLYLDKPVLNRQLIRTLTLLLTRSENNQ